MHPSQSVCRIALAACLASPGACARTHPPLAASNRLVIRAELLDARSRSFDCGKLGYDCSVVSYRPIAVREGDYSGRRLYVVHSCSEELLPINPKDTTALETFAIGDLYDLVLAKLQPSDWSTSAGTTIADRFEDKETPRYHALRTLRASGPPPVGLQKPSGCYSLLVTDYSPAMNLGEDKMFVDLPARIAVGEEPVHGLADRWRVSPGPNTPSKIVTMMRGWWEHAEGGRVRIVWTNGFSGVSVLLGLDGDTWRGQATTFWDFPRPEQTARVELRATPCW